MGRSDGGEDLQAQLQRGLRFKASPEVISQFRKDNPNLCLGLSDRQVVLLLGRIEFEKALLCSSSVSPGDDRSWLN